MTQIFRHVRIVFLVIAICVVTVPSYSNVYAADNSSALVVGHLKQLAEKGDAEAQFMLGYTYSQDKYGVKDKVKALKWIKLSAKQGYAKAQYYLFLDPELCNKLEGYRWLWKAAEQGHPAAQKYAFDPQFQYLAGRIFHIGYDGVDVDLKEATKWYQRSAEQGHAKAQYHLSVCYAVGIGVIEDYVLAYMWANLSVANGYERARESRSNLVNMMSVKQLAEAQKLSREWRPKHRRS